MQKASQISILGCGWLGLPLAESLIAQGFQVKGSTTTPEKTPLLTGKGIQAYLINLSSAETLPALSDFLQTDILVIAFPPKLRANQSEAYLKQINLLADAIMRVGELPIVFVSSTSVYPDANKIMTEEEDLTSTLPQNTLLQAENLILAVNKKTTIVRFAGLLGKNRHPGRFFAGKENIANPAAPVNLIHLTDCVQLLTKIIFAAKWGKIYNACTDEHPSRKEFYTAATLMLGLPLPQFAPPSLNDTYKIISNAKLKKDLDYQFIFPDPMSFLTELS